MPEGMHARYTYRLRVSSTAEDTVLCTSATWSHLAADHAPEDSYATQREPHRRARCWPAPSTCVWWPRYPLAVLGRVPRGPHGPHRRQIPGL